MSGPEGLSIELPKHRAAVTQLVKQCGPRKRNNFAICGGAAVDILMNADKVEGATLKSQKRADRPFGDVDIVSFRGNPLHIDCKTPHVHKMLVVNADGEEIPVHLDHIRSPANYFDFRPITIDDTVVATVNGTKFRVMSPETHIAAVLSASACIPKNAADIISLSRRFRLDREKLAALCAGTHAAKLFFGDEIANPAKFFGAEDYEARLKQRLIARLSRPPYLFDPSELGEFSIYNLYNLSLVHKGVFSSLPEVPHLPWRVSSFVEVVLFHGLRTFSVGGRPMRYREDRPLAINLENGYDKGRLDAGCIMDVLSRYGDYHKHHYAGDFPEMFSRFLHAYLSLLASPCQRIGGVGLARNTEKNVARSLPTFTFGNHDLYLPYNTRMLNLAFELCSLRQELCAAAKERGAPAWSGPQITALTKDAIACLPGALFEIFPFMAEFRARISKMRGMLADGADFEKIIYKFSRLFSGRGVEEMKKRWKSW
ncbi:hypothetical protein H0O01_04810 [Candidatus Micrarchaeota archaeon]|nr:hypothetical protein [Candidatus Micrarchaeota archaeon]